MKSAVIGVIGIVVAGAIGTTYVVGNQKHATAEKSATSASRVSKKSVSSTESSSSSEQSSSTVATSSSKQASASSSSATAPAAKSMDLSAIQNGDFSSVVGTWKNDQGDSLTINKDGTVKAVRSGQESSEKLYVTNPGSSSMANGVMTTTLGTYPLPTVRDGADPFSPISLVPKGTVDPILQTPASQDQFSDQSDHPYYRV